eukprot:3514220-Amphidinium_carterae.3
MGTLNLSPKDPRFNCQDARGALKKELDGFVKQDEGHHEALSLRTFKGRIVRCGHAIHSATQHIDFHEVGITPAAMESARTSMIAAFADKDGGESRVNLTHPRLTCKLRLCKRVVPQPGSQCVGLGRLGFQNGFLGRLGPHVSSYTKRCMDTHEQATYGEKERPLLQ